MKSKDLSVLTARVMATMFVLIGHCLLFYKMGGHSWDDASLIVCKTADILKNYIYSFHMALFMMISGYVFAIAYLPKADNIDIRQFIYNRFKRLIIPLIFVKLCFWNTINVLIGNYKWISSASFFEVGHLWYLADLFVISVFSMCFFKVACAYVGEKSRSLFILTIIFAVISLLSDLLPSGGKSMIEGVYYYSVFFGLGMLLKEYKIFDKLNSFIFLSSIIFGILISYLTAVLLLQENIIFKSVTAIFSAVGWFGMCFAIKSIALTKFFVLTEKYSMSIYLFHVPLIYFLLGKTQLQSHYPLTVMIVLFFAGYIFSIMIEIILKLLKLDFLVGK